MNFKCIVDFPLMWISQWELSMKTNVSIKRFLSIYISSHLVPSQFSVPRIPSVYTRHLAVPKIDTHSPRLNSNPNNE